MQIRADNYQHWIRYTSLLHYAVSASAFTGVYFGILGAGPDGKLIHWVLFAAIGASEIFLWWPLTRKFLTPAHAKLLECRQLGADHPNFVSQAKQMVRDYIRALLFSDFVIWAIYYLEGLVALWYLLFWAGESWNRSLVISGSFMMCMAIFVLSRLFYWGLILNSILNPFLPEDRYLFRFRLSYRIRLFMAACLIGTISTSLLVLYATYFIGFTFDTLVFYAYIPVPLSIFFSAMVGAFIFKHTEPVEEYALAVEQKGRCDDPQIVARAFRRATFFPYRTTNYLWIGMWAVGGGFILYLQVVIARTPPTDAAVLLAGVFITSIGVCLYQMNWFRAIFRSVLRHISMNHPEFDVESVGRAIGVRTKLLLTFVGLLVFSLTFAYVTTYQQHLTVLRTQYAKEARRWVSVASERVGSLARYDSALDLYETLGELEAGRAGYLVLKTAGGFQTRRTGNAALEPSELDELAQVSSDVWDLRTGRKTVAQARLSDGTTLFAVIPWDQELFTPVGFIPNLFFFLGLSVVGLGVVFYSAKEFSDPVVELTQSAQALARGDLEHPVVYSEPDEIGRLAYHFEHMRRALKDKIADLERANAETQAAQNRLLEQERLVTIGQMASGIAHEIRNPLSSIKMNLQILEKKIGGGARSESRHFRIAIGEVERLDRIVSDLLLYARPIVPTLREVSAYDVLEQAAAAVQAQADEKKIRITPAVAPQGLVFRADAERLHQVLLNLLLNAVHASPAGGRVALSAGRNETGPYIEVSDEGPGISAENFTRIYDPFFTTKADGTGLGLANARKIVHAHGGEIRVRSAPGRGATFTVELPG